MPSGSLGKHAFVQRQDWRWGRGQGA